MKAKLRNSVPFQPSKALPAINDCHLLSMKYASARWHLGWPDFLAQRTARWNACGLRSAVFTSKSALVAALPAATLRFPCMARPKALFDQPHAIPECIPKTA
jgi:hypothetical protein